jgi:hypothetical protein
VDEVFKPRFDKHNQKTILVIDIPKPVGNSKMKMHRIYKQTSNIFLSCSSEANYLLNPFMTDLLNNHRILASSTICLPLNGVQCCFPPIQCSIIDFEPSGQDPNFTFCGGGKRPYVTSYLQVCSTMEAFHMVIIPIPKIFDRNRIFVSETKSICSMPTDFARGLM